MAQDLFSVSTRHDNTFALSPSITSAINQIGCLGFANRLTGGFTATVQIKPDGTLLKKEVVWDATSEPKFAESLRLKTDALLDEMEKALLGNGDNIGVVVATIKKN